MARAWCPSRNSLSAVSKSACAVPAAEGIVRVTGGAVVSAGGEPAGDGSACGGGIAAPAGAVGGA
ncbi:hypothetical protein [Candidatus Competibacter phosphatis]|uniref:hypothetical protein n=1 Tax=Candidatus Competibacter phosphatis TaxID=221280 RepID=UPI003B96910C